MAMPSAPLALVLLLLLETLTMAESSTKLLTIALLSSTSSTMVEATNNGGDITSESFVYSREFRAIMGREPFHISMVKEEYTENATFPWFCGHLFPLGGVLGFWGGVWLLGALFMVRKYKRRNVSFIFTFDGWEAQQQTCSFSFFIFRMLENISHTCLLQVVLMAKNYCCNTESMAKEDI